MRLPLYQVDAFASDVFRGNPAAVVPLDQWIDAPLMQAIAAENNLAETAFVVHEPHGWRIRWFTPAAEIDLCGHATLASAYVLFELLEAATEHVTFHSKSGPLTVTHGEDGLLRLDFPARPGAPCEPPPALVEALGARPRETLASRDLMAVFDTEEQIRGLAPDMRRLLDLDAMAVIVTAPGRDVDFVSRFFAPKVGISEDPVTGSAHCTLVPYWAARLGRAKLRARQVSARTGELWCEMKGDRVWIAGRAALYLEGSILVPAAEPAPVTR
jgi:PhzF family phenazine biosynthesis protein